MAARVSAQSEPQVIPCGTSIARHLDSGAVHQYLLTLAANETAVIDAVDTTGAIQLLRIRYHNQNSEDYSCSGSIAVRGDGGATRIEVSDCFGMDEGEYTISANVVSDSASQCRFPLGCGVVPSGIETAGAVLPYTFTASSGDNLNLLVTKLGTSGRSARLRLFGPDGDPVGESSCSGSVRGTLSSTGMYTVLVDSCTSVPKPGPFTMLREGNACPDGPVITYFGLSRSDDFALQPDTLDAVGRPVYIRSSGSGFSLVIEARPGITARQPGQEAFAYDANDASVLPDVQVLVSRPIGYGTPAVCDILPPQQAGVPSITGFSFDGSTAVSRAINDLGCRFNNGEGKPLGRVEPVDACTRTPVTLDFAFVDPSTTMQFCAPIARTWAFAPGDTVVKARVRDTHGAYGAEREIVVRSEGDSPFFLGDVTAGELVGTPGTVFFSGEDPEHGVEIWKTDGTLNGTEIARDLVPGPASSSPRNLIALGEKSFYVANATAQTAWVWPVNGLPLSNAPVNPAVQPPRILTAVGNRLFFFGGSDGALELWTSDGNSADANLVTELSPRPLQVDSVVASNGIFYFALRGIGGAPNVAELWRSDGTAVGTRAVQHFSFAPDADGRISALTDVRGTLYFVAGDSRFGYNVWLSDGTSDGTEQLHHFATAPTELTALGNALYLVADDGAYGSEVWRMDNSEPDDTERNAAERDDAAFGSHIAADIWPGAGGSSPHDLVVINDQLFFAANDGTHGSELWAINGTSGSAKLVKDINPGAASSNPSALANIGGALGFAADDGVHGDELWISDGSADATVLALDIEPGSASSHPDALTVLPASGTIHGAAVFRAMYGATGAGLWAVPLVASIVTPIVCPGDCDGNERVTVDELVTGVGDSLASTVGCTAMDRNDNGRITIDELVKAVNSALHGCTG